ncbi:alpha-hydroxy-acid oxidizing protein [Streptomyces sp. NPDC048606]|uniref:alpha-hydroxy-acid oxidizing protein n=1 Tax=Streptomyces sp. NPDC048606 TaxID=3154726 RepID=UPI0034396126
MPLAPQSASPPRTRPDRDLALRLLDESVRRADSADDLDDPGPAARRSLDTVERAFALYEGRDAPDLPADRVFVVPSLISRDDPSRGPEIRHLLPLLDSRYGVSATTAQHLIAALPPLVMASYGEHAGHRGLVLQTPVTADLVTDLGPDAAAARISGIVRETVSFAHDRLGARVVGLGATLPALTRFGREAVPPGPDAPIVTTGHGGTVHLIRLLARRTADTLDAPGSPLRIGVIGAAGSIGSSTLVTLLAEFPDSAFLACDRPTRLGRVRRLVEAAGAERRTDVTADPGDVVRRCRLVVSAITERLDVDALAPGMDLTGHVLIDDSQPGCVDREAWEKRGGRLLWPIGTGTAGPGPLSRRDGYSYGPGVGLLHPHDLWGCEAEAAVLALSGEHTAAVRGPVTPQAAARVGALCEQAGVRPADPQSHARPTTIYRPTSAAVGRRAHGRPAGSEEPSTTYTSGYQSRVFAEGGSRFPFTAQGLAHAARDVLPRHAFDYIAGGAGRERTVAANEEAFARWSLTYRILRDGRPADPSCTVLGTPMSFPVMLAPAGVAELAHPEAEKAAARAAAEAGVVQVLSSATSTPLEEVAEAAPEGRRWFQFAWPDDERLARSLLDRARKAGYTAVVLQGDCHVAGWRTRELDSGFFPFGRGHGLGNYLSDPRFRELAGLPAAALPGQLGPAAVRAAATAWNRHYTRPSLDPADLELLRSWTDLPLAVKGVCRADEAKRLRDAGADALIVSNHGGRQLDAGPAALDCLPAVAEAAAGLPVLFDSGVRTGTDVLIALALGASAAMIGRPWLYGLAIGGQAGVEHVLRCLETEFTGALTLTGHHDPAGLSASDLTPVTAFPVPAFPALRSIR